MSQWVRLWDDMPTDPKWRVIARKSGRSISEVMAVFNFMLVCAANATERGELSGWNDESVAAGLDLDEADIAAIRDAMQGRVINGNRLMGWEKRQPKREDGAAERAKEWRERKKAEREHNERTRTQPNAQEPPDKRREEKIDSGSSLRSDPAAFPAARDDRDHPNALDEDPKAVLFSAGLKWLAKETGKSEKSLRPMLGRMLADMGGDAHAAALLGILRDAKREGKADPVAWIQRMIAGRSPRAGPAPNSRESPLTDAIRDVLERHEEKTNGNESNTSYLDDVRVLQFIRQQG